MVILDDFGRHNYSYFVTVTGANHTNIKKNLIEFDHIQILHFLSTDRLALCFLHIVHISIPEMINVKFLY